MHNPSDLHKALKQVKYKKDKPNVNKILTLITAFLFLGFGVFILLNSSDNVTAFVVADLQESNSCDFKYPGFKLPYIKDPISCTYGGSEGNELYLVLHNNNFPEEKDLFIEKISLNNCSTNVSSILENRDSIYLTIICENTKINNNLDLEYKDKLSGLTHSVEGKLTLFKK